MSELLFFVLRRVKDEEETEFDFDTVMREVGCVHAARFIAVLKMHYDQLKDNTGVADLQMVIERVCSDLKITPEQFERIKQTVKAERGIYFSIFSGRERHSVKIIGLEG